MSARVTDRVAALKSFMTSHELRPHPWCKQAGVRSSTLYNFLAGTTQHLSSQTLIKLAKAAGVTIDELLGIGKKVVAIGTSVVVTGRVGAGARIYPENDLGNVMVPWAFSTTLDAAIIDGDSLYPVRSGWIVVYESDSSDPRKALGKLAVVTVSGRPQKMVREVLAGSQRDLYTLIGWSSAPIQDIQLDSVQLVVSIMQPLASTKLAIS